MGAIMVKLSRSDCPGCYSAFRPTTRESGVIEKSAIPKKIREQVEKTGSAWAYPPRKAMQMEAK